MWLIKVTSTSDHYSVGYFEPDGKWYNYVKYEDEGVAMQLCHFLNGGNQAGPTPLEDPNLQAVIKDLLDRSMCRERELEALPGKLHMMAARLPKD